MNRARLLLYARTLPNLRPLQVIHRLTRGLRPLVVDRAPPPPLRDLRASSGRPLPKRQSMLGDRAFTLLNLTRRVAEPGDWNDPGADLLWLYNLHYFDDLAAASAARRLDAQSALIARWLRDNPLGRGVGWRPYPLSLRIVNWIKWHLLHGRLTSEAVASLSLQGRALARRLEYDAQGNHLLANAKALVFLGIFFAGPEAEGWLARGLRLLAAELPEQILADGGHYERSPMYQAILIEDLLDMLWLAARAPDALRDRLPAAVWRATAAAMLAWLGTMTHPDGRIALFNDAAFGVAPTFEELAGYARTLGVATPAARLANGVYVLPETGYLRLQLDEATVLFDAAPLGPRHGMGHAHADTLSFEMSLNGGRLFVNGGTSGYAAGPRRDRERGTAAHNTVVVDDRDSSEVWDSFRVARFARPLDLRWREDRDGLTASAAHDGFRRQFGGPLHRRTICLSDGRLAIEDRLIGGTWRTARAHFHASPATELTQDPGQNGGFAVLHGTKLLWQITGAEARIADGFHHPEFNCELPQKSIAADFIAADVRFAAAWGAGHNR